MLQGRIKKPKKKIQIKLFSLRIVPSIDAQSLHIIQCVRRMYEMASLLTIQGVWAKYTNSSWSKENMHILSVLGQDIGRKKM